MKTETDNDRIADTPQRAPHHNSGEPHTAALPPAPEGSERIVIWPHRSLGRDGIMAVIAVAAIGFAIVVIWVAAPATWFVLFPAIIALSSLAFAFWLNLRRATHLEIIDVSANLIRVMTSYLGRHELVEKFNPHWVRVEVSDEFKIEKRLILRESGRAVCLGDCLSPQEREDLAGELRALIARMRQQPVR